MNCTTAKRKFSEAFDDRLATPVRRRFEEHLGACNPCDSAFRGYQAIFSAVRSMPSTHTDLPAPMPESSGSFVSRGPVSRFSRRIAAAAIVVLVAGASFAGFQYGKTNRAVDGVGETQVAKVDLPSKPAGRVLARAHNSMAAMASMVNAAGREPNPQVIAAVNRVARELPLRDDAVRLSRMDSNSLGSFTTPIHEFADEAVWLSENVVETLHTSPGEAADRIAAFRLHLQDRRVRDKFEQVRDIAGLYTPEPLPVRRFQIDLDDDDVFTHGIRAFVQEDHSEAMRQLSRLLDSHDLSKLAHTFHGYLNRIDVNGRNIEFHSRIKGLPEDLMWLTPEGGITIGNAKIVIRRTESGTGHEIEIERHEFRREAEAPRPKKRL